MIIIIIIIKYIYIA